jgi:hypothetical protein
MRKIFVTMLLLGSALGTFAQGTVYFSNSAFQKISSGFLGVLPDPGPWNVVPAMPGLLNFGLFYGTGAQQPANLTFLGSVSGVNSATSAGLIVNTAGNSITSLAIPGTHPGETDVWIQIAGWSASFGTDWAAAKAAAWGGSIGDYFGTSPVINVAPNAGGLGPTIGPGAIIWQTAPGTDPTRIAGGFVVFTSFVPEPSATALFGLGVAAVLILRRRK